MTHIDEALAEEPDEGEVSVRNVLERVGDPEEIASEARERLDIRQPQSSWLDPLALVLLLLGGFVFLIGWIAGVLLLWLSDAWSTRQKIIGTLFVPGGLVAPFFLLTTPASFTVSSCTTRTIEGVGTTVCQTAGDSTSTLAHILAIALLVFLIVAPIAASIYLGRTLIRVRRS